MVNSMLCLSRKYDGGGRGGGGGRPSRRDDYRGYRRSPSPYRHRRRYSRSRSYSPRKFWIWIDL